MCPTYSCTLHDLCCCTLASWSDDFKGIFIIAGLMLAFIICQFLLQSTMLQGIERYLKQAIVDKNASVSSASLVSALVGVSSILKMWLFIKSNHSNSDLNSCSWYVVSKITSQKHLCGFSKYPYPFVRPGGWGGGGGESERSLKSVVLRKVTVWTKPEFSGRKFVHRSKSLFDGYRYFYGALLMRNYTM